MTKTKDDNKSKTKGKVSAGVSVDKDGVFVDVGGIVGTCAGTRPI